MAGLHLLPRPCPSCMAEDCESRRPKIQCAGQPGLVLRAAYWHIVEQPAACSARAPLASPAAAEEASVEKDREKEHWERAKQLGDQARAAGREEVERRLAQVGAAAAGYGLVPLKPFAGSESMQHP